MTMIEKVAIALQNSFNSNDIEWCVLQSMAKAAIEAMREPTDEMVLAAFPDVCFKTAWYAMIDAALKED